MHLRHRDRSACRSCIAPSTSRETTPRWEVRHEDSRSIRPRQRAGNCEDAVSAPGCRRTPPEAASAQSDRRRVEGPRAPLTDTSSRERARGAGILAGPQISTHHSILPRISTHRSHELQASRCSYRPRSDECRRGQHHRAPAHPDRRAPVDARTAESTTTKGLRFSASIALVQRTSASGSASNRDAANTATSPSRAGRIRTTTSPRSIRSTLARVDRDDW